MGFCTYVPFSMIRFCLVLTCVGLLHAIRASVSWYLYQPCCVFKCMPCFHWSHFSPLDLTIFSLPFLNIFLISDGMGLMKTLELNSPKPLTLYMSSCRFLCYLSIARSSFSEEGTVMYLSMDIAMILGIILLSRSLSRKSIVGFLLEPMTYLVSGSWFH